MSVKKYYIYEDDLLIYCNRLGVLFTVCLYYAKCYLIKSY